LNEILNSFPLILVPRIYTLIPFNMLQVVAIKVIRNKQTGQSEGYGFVEFYSHAAAEKVLEGFTGHIMPNTDQPFRLNWASFSMGDRRSDVASDHSIFVGDLTSDVNDATLLEIFSSRYSSVKGAKVVIDATTGRSKGYGFVRFGDDNEKTHAMTEMNGVYCSTRPMRIGPATPRKTSGLISTFQLLWFLISVHIYLQCFFTNPSVSSI
jgi:RNA recognition motif-containing protein